MKRIQTDNFCFEDIRNEDLLYVDKTEFVHKMTSSGSKSFFLSRPRRFGKSLLVSTLKAYFEGKKDIFKGLKIAELQPGEWDSFPVIHLDMSLGASKENFETTKLKMQNVIEGAAEEHGVSLSSDLPPIMLNELIVKLHAQTKKQIVILVDEYDKPILDALHTEWADKAVSLCQELYQNLKSNLAIERFVFLTGVSKFSHTSLFSGYNNPTDISRNKDFSHIVGYTKDELVNNFSEYIDIAAKKLDYSTDYLLERIKFWYDGHRFTINPITLYNPVSIGKFFTENSFQNFWVETGTPAFLVNEIKNNPFELDKYIGEWYSLDEFGKYDIHNINPLSLAVQTGYLAISDVQRDEDIYEVKYDFPNFEISQSWSKEMMSLAFSDRDSVLSERKRLRTAIASGNCEDLMQCLKYIFSGASYEKIGDISTHEGYYRNMIYMLFSAFDIRKAAEEQTSTGRLDFAANNSDHAFVMELKVRNSEKETERLIEEAFTQAENSRYGEKYRLESKKIHVIAAVFDRKSRQLVDWRIKNL